MFCFQLTVLEDLSISSFDVGHPGKAHDAHVFKTSDLWVPSGGRVDRLVAKPEYHLLGDGAYPTKSYLLKPFRDDGSLTPSQLRFNRAYASCRSTIEHGIGQLKGRFCCLHFLDVRTPAKAKRIIATCCALHNFAIKHRDILEEEENDDNDGRGVENITDVDAVYGVDDAGIDKRQAIMRLLAQQE